GGVDYVGRGPLGGPECGPIGNGAGGAALAATDHHGAWAVGMHRLGGLVVIMAGELRGRVFVEEDDVGQGEELGQGCISGVEGIGFEVDGNAGTSLGGDPGDVGGPGEVIGQGSNDARAA